MRFSTVNLTAQMRQRVLIGVGLLVFGLVAYFGSYWWTYWRFVESTNNAYIRGEITPISPKISGYVVSVTVANHEPVRKGDTLLQIETVEYNQRVEAKRAEIERIDAELLGLESRKDLQAHRITQAQAELKIAEAEKVRASAELRRSKNLLDRGSTTRQRHDLAIAENSRAEGQYARAESQLGASQAELNILMADSQRLAAVKSQAQADLVLNEAQLEDTHIVAPASGIIGNKSVEQGEYVTPGKFLMALVDLDNVWIEANFKETQVTRIRAGQHVDISVDTFPDARIEGVVESVAPATGSEFSLIPAQNASGNFTKIVQRIPVRIVLNIPTDLRHALRPGMSTVVRVMTKPEDTVVARSGDSD